VASGGIEVFATGTLRGTYVWVVRTESVPPDRTSESLYAVPIDGSAAKLVVRRLRDGRAAATTPLVLMRQLSADGTKLVLEQSILGPAAHDGFVVVDLVNGKIAELARGDAKSDVMPAWSPDGAHLAFARRTTTPGSPDDGLWVINADGTGIRQLRPGSCCAQVTIVYGWTADGAGIAFAVAFEGADYSIANATTGAVTGPHGEGFSLTPADWRLKVPQFAGAFSQGNKGGEQRIDIADGIGRPQRTIWHEPSDFAKMEPLLKDARWSPIADEILYLRTGQPAKLMRVSAAGGSPAEIRTQDAPRRAEWVPDGRVAYLGLVNGAVLRVTDGTTDTVLLSLPLGASLADLAVRKYP
jgi:Tol biopolymer transport system component